MSIYNLDKSRLYFENINIEALPISIRNEFEKISEVYESYGIELGNDNEEVLIAIYKPILEQLIGLFDDNNLFITIHNNTLFSEKETITEGFELLHYKNLDYYKVNSPDYLTWFMQKIYSKAFTHGYKYKFKSDYEIYSTVFKSIGNHNNLDNLLDENYSINVVSQMYLECYGEEQGKFIKAWREIITRPVDFDSVFFDRNSKNNNEPNITIEAIDLSETKGTEKIIMLQQLGVLDFLRKQQPFIQSTNKLASAISGITGIKAETVQPYINPIINPTALQKNNPLINDKSVSRVNQKLISMGYTPPK